MLVALLIRNAGGLYAQVLNIKLTLTLSPRKVKISVNILSKQPSGRSGVRNESHA